MNKKEIAEIKKQYKPEYSCIGKIAGCYVDKDKNKVLSFNISPFELPEEELEKYFDILKSSLTGKIGGKLFNMEFPLKQEAEGGTQDAFCKLLNSKMDEGLLDAFYDRVMETYDNPESYLILAAEGTYDIHLKRYIISFISVSVLQSLINRNFAMIRKRAASPTGKKAG